MSAGILTGVEINGWPIVKEDRHIKGLGEQLNQKRSDVGNGDILTGRPLWCQIRVGQGAGGRSPEGVAWGDYVYNKRPADI